MRNETKRLLREFDNKTLTKQSTMLQLRAMAKAGKSIVQETEKAKSEKPTKRSHKKSSKKGGKR